MLSITKQQQRIINNDTRFKVIVAGRRWGKTHLSLYDSLISPFHGLWTFPKLQTWFVSPTYRQSKNIAWNILKEIVYTYPELIKKKNESTLEIIFINDSIISLKGADNEDSLRGVGLNHIICDEFAFMKLNAWNEVLRPALSDKKGSAMFIGTPDGFNHFYDFYQKGKNEEDNYKSWFFKTVDSPFIDPNEILSAKAELDEKTYRQEYEASFETASGRVYYAFDRNESIKNIEFNKELPLLIVVDFNVSPMKWAVVQQYKDFDVVIDEIVKRDTNTIEMTEEVVQRYGKNVNYTFYGDYSGTFRATSSITTDYQIIKNIIPVAKIKTKPNPPVIDRINAMNSRLKSITGQRRLFLNEKCKDLIKDFEQVIWKDGKREIDKSNMELTHISDALGYFVEYEYSLKGKPTVTHRF